MASNGDVSAVFAEYIESVKFDDLPQEAVVAAQRSCLDTIGVILGASGLVEPMAHLVDFALGFEGKAESTILGFGGKVPCSLAAFANGAMAHGLDFDDHLPEGHHPSSSLVPALLALSERLGRVSGREFVTALAIGQDVFARIRKNVEWRQDWHLSPVVGVIAVAAACSKLLGLSREQCVDAIGIAALQASGTMELAYGVGSDLRGMYAGFSSRNGLESAMLAKAGIAGTKSSLEGHAGLLPVYFSGGYDRDAMVKDLGHDFQGSTILFKNWPSCGGTHGYIDLAREVMSTNSLVASDVAHITIVGGDFAERLSSPIESRRQPATTLDSKFSIPFTVAVAVAKGTVKVGDFHGGGLADPEVLAISEKVDFRLEDSYNWTDALPGSAIEFILRDGRNIVLESKDAASLSLAHHMGWDELEEKFRDCASYSVNRVATTVLDQVIHGARHLPELADVAMLMSGFSTGAAA